MHRPTTLCALLLCAGLGLSQDPTPGQGGPLRPSGLRKVKGGEASLEDLLRRASRDQDGSRSSHTRRVVVRNGKTIVDEETVDGRPVKPGPRPRGAEDLLRELERELPADARDLLRRVDADVKSHTRRVVVRNGKTVVDEETVDGKPVRRPLREPLREPR